MGGDMNLEEAKMTWEDALRAIADGKEVHIRTNKWDAWQKVTTDLKIEDLKHVELRCASSSVRLLKGDYTKEELLNILKEFE